MPPINAIRAPWRTPRRGALALLAAVLACSTVGASGPQLDDPAGLLDELRDLQLDPDRAVRVERLELELGGGRLDIDAGVLVPGREIRGRTVELVFVGRARFRLEPPDRIEAGQLELFTGSRSLDAPVESALIVLADQSAVRRLLDRPPPRPVSTAAITRARAIHDDWRVQAGRYNTGVDVALFKSLAGDPTYGGYFAMWCDSYELGGFVWQSDPDDPEPLTLSEFNDLPLTGWDRLRLRRRIRIQQRKGRMLGVRVEDLGSWDVWLSTALRDDEGRELASGSGFEARHYRLDVTISGRDRRLRGTAEIEIEAVAAGRRTVALELFRDLRITGVRDGQGRSLFAARDGEQAVVLLPEVVEPGSRLRLIVDYEGHVLRPVPAKSWDLEDSTAWYPHCGTIDRATYDVTLHWPRHDELMTAGRLVEAGREGALRWERRVLDTPAIAVSFVLGRFAVDRMRIGDVDLRIAYARKGPGHLTREVRERMGYSVARALEFFERTFGPYPLDELTVVVLPRAAAPDAQSLLGLLTFSDEILDGGTVWSRDSIDWRRDAPVAHEVAHQWWGNLVGWSSYRDQWLSEGMANYSAMLYFARVNSRDDHVNDAFLARMSAGWRDSLARRTAEGRTIDSLGPIVLGPRLNSSRAGNAYSAIVYRKGAVVLAMLARAFGEEAFVEMLRSIVDVAANRPITTESFLAALERMSGLDLDGFAQQFVYGTGIPQVYYDHEIARDVGGWTVSGHARQLARPSWRQRVVRRGESWDVLREPAPDRDRSSTLVVPFRVPVEPLADPDDPASARRRESLRGRLILDPAQGTFEIPSTRRPLGLELDPGGEIFAWFVSRERQPKRAERLRAADLLAEERVDEAEAVLRGALDLPVGETADPPEVPWLRDPADVEEVENARIRLTLARLALDAGRDEAAASELDAVDALLVEQTSAFPVERDALRARLELRAGEDEAAYDRLRRLLRRAHASRETAGGLALLERLRLNTERLALNEAWALLTVAARRTGRGDEFDEAEREARRRGVGVSALDDGPLPPEMLPASTGMPH